MLKNLRVNLAIIFYTVVVVILTPFALLLIQDATLEEAWNEYLKGYAKLDCEKLK